MRFRGIEEHCHGELICFMKNQPTIYPGRAAPLKYAKMYLEDKAGQRMSAAGI